MPKHVLVQPRIYLGFGSKKYHRLGIMGKCDHCKGHHELCLIYNSENNFSLWVDMMEKDLKWNKQQNLDDENQEATHNIEFKKKAKYTLQQRSITFGML